MRRARKRLALDANGPPRQIKPGGEWEGRPGEYALTRFNYYRCEKVRNWAFPKSRTTICPYSYQKGRLYL